MKVGILGTGQLAHLFGLVSKKCACEIIPFGPSSIDVLGDYTQPIYGDYSDKAALQAFASQVDVLTYETETIDLSVLDYCSQYVKVFPARDALKVAQDRLFEKQMFNRLEIPTNQFYGIEKLQDIETAAKNIGFPSILKTRTQGYDGKGQAVVKNVDDLSSAWLSLNQTPCILESFVNFQREVSIISVRDRHRNFEFFPLSQNYHQNGILRYSFPLESDSLQKQAELYAKKVMNDLGYVGCMAIEFFDCDGELYTNEVAPRVHNSGHWTLEGASMSQFEMHLRAICGEIITQPKLSQAVVMANIIGNSVNADVLNTERHIKLYDYGKALKPNRKMGHFTLTDHSTTKEALVKLQDIYQRLGEIQLAKQIQQTISEFAVYDIC